MSTKLFRYQHTYVLECGKGLMNIEQLTRKNLFHPKSEVAQCWYQELASWKREHMLNSEEENWNCRAHVDRSCENRQEENLLHPHIRDNWLNKALRATGFVLHIMDLFARSRAFTKWIESNFRSFMREWVVNLSLWVNIVVKTVAYQRHDDGIQWKFYTKDPTAGA